MELAPIESRRNVRLARTIAERRIAIGAWLAELAPLVASFDLHVGAAQTKVDPQTVILVALDDEGPVVIWPPDSGVTAADLADAGEALRHVAYRVTRGETDFDALVAGTREDHQRRHQARLAERTRIAERLRSVPWECEFCRRRFKTKRGAEQHERVCRCNPDRRRRRRRSGKS